MRAAGRVGDGQGRHSADATIATIAPRVALASAVLRRHGGCRAHRALPAVSLAFLGAVLKLAVGGARSKQAD